MSNQNEKRLRHVLLRSPWLELIVLISTVVLSYTALLLITAGATIPPGGMALTSITMMLFGFFLLSFAIAVIAVLAGIGGGVIYTPIMMAFTPVNSLIIRATGLVVAMFSGLVSSGTFLKRGVANLKLSILCCAGYGVGGFIGAKGAIHMAKTMGVTGEGIIRVSLGFIVLSLGVYFYLGGVKSEWPVLKQLDRFSRRLNLGGSYYEESLRKVVDYRVNRTLWGILLMFGIGLISGLFGLGAGWAIVPALNLVMVVPLKIAASCSGVIIGMGDCLTVWPYLHAGAIIPLFVAPWLFGQVLGGMLGAQVLIKVRSSSIRYILIGILFYTSYGLLTNGFGKLKLIPNIPGLVNVAVLVVMLTATIIVILKNVSKPVVR